MLVRVALVFARRGYNIESLVVSADVANGEFSRITMTCRGDLDTLALALVLMVTPFVVSARMLDEVGAEPLLAELERIVDAALRP